MAREREVNRMVNVGDPASKSLQQTVNTAGESMVRSLDGYRGGRFYKGTVIISRAGTYDVVVRCRGGQDLTCTVMTGMANYIFGTNYCSMPVEGTKVLVYLPYPASNYGLVVGVCPSSDSVSPVDGSTPPLVLADLFDIEPGVNSVTEENYIGPVKDKNDTHVVNANAGRPLDVFPGDQVWSNEQGVAIALLRFIATLRATDRAKIEVSALDDMVRIASGLYQHISTQGTDYIFNDGGYITRELTGTTHQAEHSGYKQFGQSLFKSGSDKTIKTPKSARYEFSDQDVTSKKRFQLFTGFLGDIINLFVANPDPELNPEKTTDDNKDQGLLQTHIDASGRLIIRSAGGISFQRWDRIPVPKRQFAPWDPKGDKVEKDDEPPTEKKPVKFSDEFKYGRSLQLRDASAWRNRMAYQRVHDQSKSAGKKDFYLPEESELDVPQDVFDEVSNSSHAYNAQDHKQAYLNMEDDGSIILRDSWGSEIILRGGNIILNCPGQIEARAGKGIVQLAGHDVIIKGRKSVDISATDKDVRIKANTNLHMLSDGEADPDTGAEGGGILLESKSKDENSNFDSTGEKALSKGIILKAEKSRIFMQAKTAHVSASDNIFIETFSEGGTPEGNVFISAGKVYTTSDQFNLTVGEKVGLLLSRSQAALAAPSISVAAGGSIGIFEGSKAWVPLMKASIESSPYDEIKPFIEQLRSAYWDETNWLAPYEPDKREDIKFTYRSSEEYGTIQGTEVYEASKFVVYQASWAYLLDNDYKFIEGTLDTWTDRDIDDTWPWPGEKGYSGDCYVKLQAEKNIDDPKTGIPKSRKSLTEEVGQLKLQGSFNEYEVMKHT